MNAMGHGVPTMIGVEQRDVARKINRLIPGYMAMGSEGMAEMGDMEMEIPENTAPMMTGTGPHGSLEMGGMFSMVKVRRDQKRGDYTDPGWYKPPAGTRAHEWTGALAEPVRPADTSGPAAVEVQVRKPQGGHEGHH
jgi:hypothetical protein